MVVIALFSLSGMAFNSPQAPGAASNARELLKTADPVQTQLRYFRVHRQGRFDVSVNWGLTSEAGILAFSVERSYDGDFFDPVMDLPANGAPRYSVKDEQVFPGYIHYRLGCIMNDGSTIYSGVETVRIVQR